MNMVPAAADAGTIYDRAKVVAKTNKRVAQAIQNARTKRHRDAMKGVKTRKNKAQAHQPAPAPAPAETTPATTTTLTTTVK